MEIENVISGEAVDTELENAWNDEEPEAVEQEQDAAPAEERHEEPGQEGEPAGPAQAQPELFTLKNRDQTRSVTREEMIAMAQKGWDYDTVRQERDQLRREREETAPAVEVVKKAAEKNGMTVPQYLEALRKDDLMRRGMSEQEAEREISYENRKAALDAQEKVINAHKQQQEAAVQAQRSKQERVQRETADFLNAFPDVKVSELPREVWDEVAKGVPMVTAYTMHENKRLQAELAAERQNNANRQRTPGSLGGNAAAEMDEIDRLWYEDD